jgi:hypothetical protein
MEFSGDPAGRDAGAAQKKVGGGGTAMRDGRTALTMPISIEDGESFS